MVKSNIPLQEAGGPAYEDPNVEVIGKGTTTATSSAPSGKIKIKRKRPISKESSTSKDKPEVNVQKEESRPEIHVQNEEEKRVGGDKAKGENVTDQPPPGPTSTVDEGVQGPSPGGKEPSPTKTADDAGKEPSPTGVADEEGTKDPSPDKNTSAAVDGLEEPILDKTSSTVGDEGN